MILQMAVRHDSGLDNSYMAGTAGTFSCDSISKSHLTLDRNLAR
jgi:hypothetical protein